MNSDDRKMQDQEMPVYEPSAENSGAENGTGSEGKIQLPSAVMYTYDALRNTNRALSAIMLRMKEEVDAECAKKAVKAVSERYSFLNLKRVRDGERIAYVRQTVPIPCMHKKGTFVLGGKNLKGSLMAFAYYGDEVVFEAFHAVMDGYGMIEMLRTFIYYYCVYRYGEEPEMPGVRKLGDVLPQDEYEDILSKPMPGVELPPMSPIPPVGMVPNISGEAAINITGGIPQNISVEAMKNIPGGIPQGFPAQRRKFAVISELGYTRCAENEFRNLFISVSLKELLETAKQHNHSVTTLLTAVFNKAICDLHPEIQEEIRTSLAVSVRPAYHGSRTLQNGAAGIYLVSDGKLRERDVLEQGTDLRAQLAEETKPQKLLPQIMFLSQAAKQVESMPLLYMKGRLLKKMLGAMRQEWTYKISYPGKMGFGEAEKFIRDVYTLQNTTSDGITMQILATEQQLCISYIQDFKEEFIVRHFVELLNELGIPSAVHESRKAGGMYVKGFQK